MTITTPDRLLAAGIAAGWLLAWYGARRRGVTLRQLVLASVLCAAGAGVGVLIGTVHAVMAAPGPQTAWHPRADSYMVLVCASALAAALCMLRRINLARMADVAGPALLLVMAFARAGCFLKGCCWGDACADPELIDMVLDAPAQWQVYTIPAISGAAWPLAVAYPRGSLAHQQHVLLGLLDGTLPGSLPCHPVQLYEAGMAALAALCLACGVPRRAFPGCVMALACGVYGSLRFLLEFLRADHSPYWCGLTLPQITSVALVVFGAAIFVAGRHSVAHPHGA